MKELQELALAYFKENPYARKAGFAEWLAGNWEGKSNHLRMCFERVAYEVMRELKREGRLVLSRGAKYKVPKFIEISQKGDDNDSR